MTRYWLGVVSQEHVQRGVQGGFAQVCHGKRGPLEQMKAGDWLIYYSPRVALDRPEKCQAFTAIGILKKGATYQVQMTPDFRPFRRDVKYFPCREVSLLEVFDRLLLTKNRRSWGMQLRRGLLELEGQDFMLLAESMGVGAAWQKK